MTKEHKLALILGFTLVLIVGILISDHFSRARRDPLGPTVAAPPLSNNRVSVTRETVREVPERAEAIWTDEPLPPVREIVMGSPEPEPVEAEAPVAHAADDPLLAAYPDMFEPASSQREVIRTEPDPAPIVSRPPPVPVLSDSRETIEGKQTHHVVRPNESLWKIAEKYYGDGKHWKRLQKHNPDAVNEDGEVYAGARLVIPSEMDELKRPSAGSAAARPASSGPKIYTVQKGDSLGEIAQDKLGSARRWRDIYELNKAVIDDPDVVPAGVTLKLPSN